jgi:predicted phosphoadenosine phosphosulfate sulfurtransferase
MNKSKSDFTAVFKDDCGVHILKCKIIDDKHLVFQMLNKTTEMLSPQFKIKADFGVLKYCNPSKLQKEIDESARASLNQETGQVATDLVREMPDLDCVVNIENCPYEFIKGTKGFDARIQFAEWFSSEYGTTAVMVGLRADESLSRQAIFTSKHRTEMHKKLTYTKTVNKTTCNFYPIYDWETKDIWVANYKFNWDYNKIYDLYYQAGLTIDQMRVASPFHQCGQDSLKLYRVIDPNSWGKMVGRVNGCNFGGIYGGTSAMGWRTITKPSHFTWKQYAEFLIDTLPENTKKKISISKISKIT